MSLYRLLPASLVFALCALLTAPAFAEDDPFGDSGDDPFGGSSDDPFGDSSADGAAKDGVRLEDDSLIGRVRLGAGGLALVQSFNARSLTAEYNHAPPVYFGGTLELDISLFQIESWGATTRLILDGAFGAARESKDTPELGRPALVDYYQGGARLGFTKALFEHTDITPSVGFNVTSLIVEPNNSFTGSRYIGAVVGLDLTQWLFEDLIGLTARAAAMPVLASNTSDGAEGESDTFGWRLGAGLTWNIVPSYDDPTRTKMDLELRYTHQHYATQYPVSPSWGAADATDMQDMISLMFHISL